MVYGTYVEYMVFQAPSLLDMKACSVNSQVPKPPFLSVIFIPELILFYIKHPKAVSQDRLSKSSQE